jgi:Ni,Fe-hydrogenase I small subunit
VSDVGGICIGCTMPGFSDKHMPFMKPDPWGNAVGNTRLLAELGAR